KYNLKRRDCRTVVCIMYTEILVFLASISLFRNSVEEVFLVALYRSRFQIIVTKNRIRCNVG
uniref:hypothetical protein n=1 Tax=Paenisporosarcina sp. TG20 TaxID=1211706 RepID=UPI001ED8F233